MLSSVTLGWALTLSGHTLWTLAGGGTAIPAWGQGAGLREACPSRVRDVGVCPSVLGAPR